jgi:TRAP-type transport system periplasmic protein
MGAEPVLIEASAVPQAFATGMIQAMVTSSAFGASVQAWDFVDVYNGVGAWLGLEETLVSERAFQRLAPEVQQAVLEAAQRAAVRGMAMAIEADQIAKSSPPAA